MPTSVTGTSSRPRRGRAAASRVSGFTLLEILVVVVIIGIITTMAVVSTRVLGGDHEMDQETKRLVAVLAQVREDAMLEGRDVGLRIDALGYDFLRYDGRNERWDTVTEDPLLRERLFPDGMSAGLWLESRRVQLPERSLPNERAPASPQVQRAMSGELPIEHFITHNFKGVESIPKAIEAMHRSRALLARVRA